MQVPRARTPSRLSLVPSLLLVMPVPSGRLVSPATGGPSQWFIGTTPSMRGTGHGTQFSPACRTGTMSSPMQRRRRRGCHMISWADVVASPGRFVLPSPGRTARTVRSSPVIRTGLVSPRIGGTVMPGFGGLVMMMMMIVGWRVDLGR